MKITRLKQENVTEILKGLQAKKFYLDNIESIYDIYLTVIEGIEEVITNYEFKEYNIVNPIVVILYILNELSFNFKIKNIDEKKMLELLQNDEFLSFISSLVCDKYLTNEQLNYKSNAFLNKFNPQISTISLFLNCCLNILNKKYEVDKYTTLVQGMLKNSFSLGQCILNLLMNGFDVEAFSTWRTMHENECILYCLVKNGKDIFDAYFRHIDYSLAYRGQFGDKEKTDEIFIEIKENMRKYDLKSKDMKKYIEYGYLFALKDKTFNVDFKLNFRDGIETIAGLNNYSKVYELSSEISHSSPLLIFSNREYYFTITLLNLYESFFRLESVFFDFFKKIANKNEVLHYETLRKVYMSQLRLVYGDLINIFKTKFSIPQHLDNKNHQ